MRLKLAAALVAATLLAPLSAHAETELVSEDTAAVAGETGIDPLELQGAVNTTGVAAREYLYAVAELARPAPPVFGAVARADCIIGKESGGLDVPNRGGSGANGPGQYFPGTWAYHVGLYRAATGYVGGLSLHVLADVRRVMAYVLTIPGQRAHWTVAGC